MTPPETQLEFVWPSFQINLTACSVSMKSCTYCGKTYPNDVIVCPADNCQLVVAHEALKKENDSRQGSVFWWFFNVFFRAAGILMVVNGSVFTLWGLSLILRPNSIVMLNGMPNRDPFLKRLMLGMGLGTLVLGILVLVSRRYRPDLGDKRFSLWRRR